MRTGWIRGIFAAAVLLVAAPAAIADDDPAVRTVQTFYDTLLDTMKQGKQLGYRGRYERLKPAVEQAYDFTTMMRFIAGSSWATLPPADQQALIQAFERMTIANYASNFDSFGGEKFIVEPATQSVAADKRVLSKLVTGGQTIPFNYRLRLSGGSWKIIDIYLNGTISQLATKRSDFGPTLSSGGAQALIKKMDAISESAAKQ